MMFNSRGIILLILYFCCFSDVFGFLLKNSVSLKIETKLKTNKTFKKNACNVGNEEVKPFVHFINLFDFENLHPVYSLTLFQHY